jgi:hypothetical protein
MVGFYKQIFESIDQVDIERISGDFIWAPNYVGKRQITDDDWKVIGNSSKLFNAANIPHLVVVNDLYFKDEIVQRLSRNEIDKYPVLSVAGGGAIESRLRRYFGV